MTGKNRLDDHRMTVRELMDDIKNLPLDCVVSFNALTDNDVSEQFKDRWKVRDRDSNDQPSLIVLEMSAIDPNV